MDSPTSITFSVAILAGGMSRRMGVDKCLVDLGGKPLLQHVLERVRRLDAPVLLVTNAPERYSAFDVPMIPDAVPGKGSLGGIYTAVGAATTPLTLCVACDMPFLNVDLLRYLLSLTGDFDAVVPIVGGLPQGLHAIYHRRCLEPMRELIDGDQLRIAGLFERLRVRLVDEPAMRAIDPALRSFVNLNTPQELSQARAEIGSGST